MKYEEHSSQPRTLGVVKIVLVSIWAVIAVWWLIHVWLQIIE
jgi:hypothetical protein